MIGFQYNASEYEERSYQTIPEGDHRVRINEVTEQISKNSGKQMLKFILDVSGYTSKLFYYLVFDPNNQKLTNQKVGEIFDSFGITNPDVNMYPGWIGKVGVAKVKHEAYNGEISAKVAYFIGKKKQAKLNLPEWKEPATPGQAYTWSHGMGTPPTPPAPMYAAAPQYQPGYQPQTPIPPQPTPQQQSLGFTPYESDEQLPF